MKFREVPIGAAFDVRNGATPASGEPSYWNGDIPWVGPADLGKLKSRTIERGERSITPEGYESCGTQMVPAGSIILSIRAPIGHMAIASSVQNLLQNAFMAAVGLAGRAWRLRVSASARPARRRQAASACSI